MGVHDELRRTGRASGMEIGGDIVVAPDVAGCESCSVLGRQRRCKLDDAFRRRRVRHRHPNDPEVGDQRLNRERLLPDVELRVRPQRHQNCRAGRLDQLGDVLRLQQEINGYRIACGLSAPQREMRFDQAWQHVGHARRSPADG